MRFEIGGNLKTEMLVRNLESVGITRYLGFTVAGNGVLKKGITDQVKAGQRNWKRMASDL